MEMVKWRLEYGKTTKPYVWGDARASPGFHYATPLPSTSIYLGVFHSLFTCHWISFVFLLYDRRICTHSIDHSLAVADFEFPRLGLALVPDVVVPEAEHGVRMKQKSRFKFLPWPEFEPRTSQSNALGRKKVMHDMFRIARDWELHVSDC